MNSLTFLPNNEENFLKTMQTNKILPFSFYRRPAEVVAFELLGCFLIYEFKDGVFVGGKIVETEAYLGEDDPACHSARGKTRANEVMFGPAGRAYVYHIYGRHLCFNITTDVEEIASAVLIRALEPLVGLEIMMQNRGKKEHLTDGPARLTEALGITKENNGQNLVKGPIYVLDKIEKIKKEDISVKPRIGITKASEWPLRFYLKDSKWVSKK